MNRSRSLFGFSECLGPRQKWLPYGLLLTITLVLYGPSLYFDLVWDDIGYITKNYRIQGLDWRHIRAVWTHFYFGHYAPVHNSLLQLIYHFSGRDPFGYHATQLVLHALCVCLVYALVQKLESARLALVVALLFAVHPANVETVAWISETKSTLAFFFFLLSFWFFIRMRERENWLDGLWTGLFLILSVLSKINTIVAPMIFLLYDYKQGASLKKLRWASLLPFFVISGVFTLVHLRAFHGSAEGMETQYLGGPWLHWINFPLLLSFYLQMTVLPLRLSAWEMFPTQGHFSWIVALGWIGLAALAWLLSRTSRTIQFWGLWILVFLLPVLQIIPFPIWVADRYLYIPAIGGFTIAGIYFFEVSDRVSGAPRSALEAAMIAAILVLAIQTKRQVPIWRNDLTLWAATLPTCELSAYCHGNLGIALLQNGRFNEGIDELIKSVKMRGSGAMLERLGDAFTLAMHDYPRAIEAYSLEVEQEGRSPVTEVYGKLGRAYALSGDLNAAKQTIEFGKNVNPNDLGIWITEGFVLWKEGDWDGARYSLRRSLAMAGGTVNSTQFFGEFFADAALVGRMLADLRS